MKQDTNTRLNWLAKNMPMPRGSDEHFWGAVINAWFLCGIIRMSKNADDRFKRDVLRYSSPIIWC